MKVREKDLCLLIYFSCILSLMKFQEKIYLFSYYTVVSLLFTFMLHAKKRVQYIDTINRVTLYSICLCRYIIQLKALNLMPI